MQGHREAGPENLVDVNLLKVLAAGLDLEQPLADRPLEYQGAPVPRRANQLALAGRPRRGTS
ncbi:hypothetical protein KUTG_01073 [Kutzneria sp. 744]|nr:hypothetical protein KUTG_01073 [Kutzneria sp. 744]